MADKIKIVRTYLNTQLHRLESLLATTDYDYEETRACYEEQKMYVEEQIQVLETRGIKGLKAFRKMVQEEENAEA